MRALIFAILLISNLNVLASDPVKPWTENGIWTGTIGDSKVMACFQRDVNPAYDQAAYFYLRYGKRIPLAPVQSSKTSWLEGDSKSPSGIWIINVQQDQIWGNWSNAAKTKSLPILLNRFKSISSDHSQTCSPHEDTFSPVVYKQSLSEKITRGDEQTFNGRRYRVISALQRPISSIELIGEGEAISYLNTLLMNELRAGLSAYYECPTYEQSEKSDYSSTIDPLFWNAQWISLVIRTSGDCGGAYPFSNYSYSTWNLVTGKQLKIGGWINYRSFNRLNKIITKRAIKQRIAFNPKEASEENNCLSTIQSNSDYQIRLSKKGFIFTQNFPHVVQACTDDIEITYDELMPFLTKKGKEAVMAIRKNGS